MSITKKDFNQIADDILCGVDYDIYKDDCNEMNNELRDEIECRLIREFGCFDEMYEELQELSNWLNTQLGMGEWHKDIEKLLAKARGEQK